jgi:hypothetical protein
MRWRAANGLGRDLRAELVLRPRQVRAQLDDGPPRRDVRLREVAGARLVDLARVDLARRELDGC